MVRALPGAVMKRCGWDRRTVMAAKRVQARFIGEGRNAELCGFRYEENKGGMTSPWWDVPAKNSGPLTISG